MGQLQDFSVSRGLPIANTALSALGKLYIMLYKNINDYIMSYKN
ncbi:MAG: hypothetical protein RLZZ156_649 [Deinococcota bacterium]|jgi:hypothetical protein